MNILTKISVVLVVVAGLFMSVVLVNMATTQPNWKARAEAEQLKAEAANTQAQNMALAAYRAQRNYESVQDKLTALRGDLAKQLADKDELIKKDDLAASKAKADYEGLANHLGQLENDLKLIASDADKKNDAIKSLRDTVKTLNDEAAAMLKANNQVVSERDRLAVLVRSYMETIVGLQEQLVKATEKASQTTPDKSSAAVAADEGTKVDGQVTGTKGNTASVNIGSTKSIAKGMKLFVCRGNEVVGHLQVTEVDLTECAGVVVDGTARQGDEVTTSLK